jgi:hypothetical protein
MLRETQTALSPFDVDNCTEAVMLQLEYKIRIIKSLLDQTELHGLDCGEHNFFYPNVVRTTFGDARCPLLRALFSARKTGG